VNETYILHITAEGQDFGAYEIPRVYAMWSEHFECEVCGRVWGKVDWVNNHHHFLYQDCENCWSERANYFCPGSLWEKVSFRSGLEGDIDLLDLMPNSFVHREFWLHLMWTLKEIAHEKAQEALQAAKPLQEVGGTQEQHTPAGTNSATSQAP
jgi:hypothetical protein